MTLTHTNPFFPKLLASENITIEYGNITVPYFDVQSRVLGLPVWNNPDTHNFVSGHEIGHAKYTPFQEWKEVLGSLETDPSLDGVTKDLVNIIEDVRIERLMLKRFPGLNKDFQRGYRVLLGELDYFGLKGKTEFTAKDMSFLDRVNIKSKARHLVTVAFTAEEQELFDACYETETFNDVIELAKRFAAYVKAKKNEAEDTKGGDVKNPEKSKDLSDNTSEDSGEGNGDAQESDEGDAANGDFESADEGTEEATDGDDREDGDGEDVKSIVSTTPDSTKDSWTGKEGAGLDFDVAVERTVEEELTSETQAEFDKNLVADAKDRRGCVNTTMKVPPHRVLEEHCFVRIEGEAPRNYAKDQYTKFLAENKSVINMMVREFEIRKKAAQYRNAKIVKTGTLDLKKLHEYRYNDEIFVRGMKVPGGKSHGMVMLIDFSGSMCNVLDKVIEQTLQLTLFCKKVNIPFAVYSFTNGWQTRWQSKSWNQHGEVCFAGLQLKEWLNSNMDKAKFERNAIEMLTKRHSLGGTPLSEALIALQPEVKKIKKTMNLDRMNLVVLTDGDGARLTSTTGEYTRHIKLDATTTLSVDPYADLPYGEAFGDDLYTKGILEWYKTSGAADTITHYFLMEKSACREYGVRGGKSAGATIKKNINGYDTKFLIPVASKILSSETVDLEFDEDAKKGAIVKAFKAHAGSKKGNRVLVTTFAETIS